MSNLPNVVIFTTKSPPDEVLDSLSVPIGLYNLQHVLKSHDIRCDVIDHQIDAEADYLSKIESGFYNIIGISVTHWRMPEDLGFLHRIREVCRKNNRQPLFIAGGLQATINHKQWLEAGFDLVCLGFAEETLLNVCNSFTGTGTPLKDMFGNCKGVAFLDADGRLFYNPAKPLTQQAFEKLMFDNVMNMELPYKKYWDFIRKRATGILTANNRSYIIENGRILTSSKCLARCGFCCCPDFLEDAQGAPVKPMNLSAEQVGRLIVNFVTKYGARSFSINDEDFLIGNKKGIERAMEICGIIVDAKNKGKIPQETRFSCQTRPNCFIVKDDTGHSIINHPLMQALYKAGFHNVTVGIETFSDKLLKSPSVHKNITVAECHNVVHALMENKLYPTINLILGIPESTKEELFETIRQVLVYTEKPCQVSLTTRMRSFPGAPIFGSDKYSTLDTIFVNPSNGQNIRIPTFFKVQDPEMESLMEKLDDTVLRELDLYKSGQGLDKSALLPRIIISLITFVSIAKIAGNTDLLYKVTATVKRFSGDTGARPTAH